jgi:hypothetical protein
MPAAKGNPEAAIVEECDANCDAVSLRVCNAWVVTFANANLAPFSIAVHLTSTKPCMTETLSQLQAGKVYTKIYFGAEKFSADVAFDFSYSMLLQHIILILDSKSNEEIW